jgi:DNA repair protein RadD
MRIRPRSYQIEAVDSLYHYFSAQTGNPVIAMPTGTGKSVVIAMFLEAVYAAYPGQRIMVLTHVKELIQQNYDKLMTLWPSAPAGIYSAGLNRRDVGKRITFAGIGSVARKAHYFGKVDLMIVDEAHLVSPETTTLYQKFIAELKVANPLLKVIGLTATPWRLGMGRITDGGLFTDICFDITGLEPFNRLIAEGFLSPLIPRQTTQMLDTDGVHMRGGEFIASELQHAVDKFEITQGAMNEMCALAENRKHWLIFASGVEHADHIAEILNDNGVPAVSIHSKMGDSHRDAAIEGFKSGKYRAAVNNNVLTTGFDFPAIDCIGVLRPTASTVLWVQMLGRGTRPVYAPGYNLEDREQRLSAIAAGGKQNCLVLDFAGNTRRLGPINDPVIPRKKGDKTGQDAPVKLCSVCNVYNHASVKFCFHCGNEFVFQVKFKQVASSEKLLRGDAPVVEVFTVDHITYSVHRKMGRPPMLKATYYCGLRAFSDYVCIEHEGFAQRKARQWWAQRSKAGFPSSTQAALALADTLVPATHLRVWVNKQYPEIMSQCFDGTAFGTGAAAKPPDTSVETEVKQAEKVPANYEDDDIPF